MSVITTLDLPPLLPPFRPRDPPAPGDGDPRLHRWVPDLPLAPTPLAARAGRAVRAEHWGAGRRGLRRAGRFQAPGLSRVAGRLLPPPERPRRVGRWQDDRRWAARWVGRCRNRQAAVRRPLLHRGPRRLPAY